MMPLQSGYEVLTEIRKHHSAMDLPVLMATAKSQSEDIVSAFEIGANDYITKPINFPVASDTTAYGINDNGDIAGFYTDSAGKSHGFVYADNNFSTVDVAGASATELTRIKNWGQVTGVYVDALTAEHGLISQ